MLDKLHSSRCLIRDLTEPVVSLGVAFVSCLKRPDFLDLSLMWHLQRKSDVAYLSSRRVANN